MKLYNRILVDAIINLTSNNGKFTGKVLTLISLSFFNGINLLSIEFILFLFNIKIPIFINYHVSNHRLYNSLLASITYLLPFLILNYFLIIRKKRYEKLTAKYQYSKGSIFRKYIILSCLFGLVTLLLLALIKN